MSFISLLTSFIKVKMKLVKRMADRTQFLYISHNRLTMEMAEQLIGVTMQEQGVSRIVAVDIVEALKMREQ